jgi:alpha-galactosidase
MKTRLLVSIAALAWFLSAQWAVAVSPTAAEIAEARQWAAARFGDVGETRNAPPFFSFTYGGTTSAELLKTWKVQRATRRIDDRRTEHTLTYSDPKTGLVLRCVGVEYSDFPAVEWMLHFENTGTADTPILADIQTIDAGFVRPSDAEFTLHRIKGDLCAPDSFQPLTETLGPKAAMALAPVGGRPTCDTNPYWNFETEVKGFIVALGWPGQWLSRFDRDEGRTLRIRAGQELTHFTLRPGEEARSPLVALLFYQGDWIRGQNLWRRWMVAHNIPRPGGKLVPTHYGTCWSIDLHPSAEVETAILRGFLRGKIPLEFYYIDAGWYPGKGNWWESAGTWEVDRQRFPKGIREVSDLAHANGMQFVLWFEPERAWAGSWLAENHPEWILGGKGGGLVNLGNPDAWRWIVDRIDSLITSEGVDVYRQDFNIAPLGYWRGADAPDRQGMTEMNHCVGYLAFWDELLRRHPKLWIDSCASGGRRNDLETMRRSVPLLRSDCAGDPLIQQCHTYGLSLWLPYYGSGQGMAGVYWFRSCIFPASRIGCDTRNKDLDYALLRRMIAEYHKVQPYLLGDYYPLTPYSLEKNAWIGWQFDEPALGGGFVQAFRRDEAKENSFVLKLQGLVPDATYAVENLDDGKIENRIGKDLMTTGLHIKIITQPGSALFVYRKVQ